MQHTAMASCAAKPTFKPLLTADANSSSRRKSYPRPLVSFSLKRSFENHKFSNSSSKISLIISVKSSLSAPRPSFSLREGISSSLAQCLSYWTADLRRNEGKEKQKVVNEVEEEEHKLRWDCTLKDKAIKMFYQCFVKEPPFDALVELIVSSETPDFAHPWRMYPSYYATNGFLIEGRMLLTCAHCIEHHTKVRIKKYSSFSRLDYDYYKASVLAVAPECDLAILTVTDDEFWEGVRPVVLGDMPSATDKLTVMSYTRGFDYLTPIRGFVTHVGMVPYCHRGLNLPTFGVNFDLEGGHPGSAVFKKGKCVGIAFQSTSREKPCEVIPVSIIKHFIQDYKKNGGYTGLPIFGVKWQKMENHDLRMSMRIKHDQQGVLVRDIEANCPEFQVLKPYDVILSIDGVKIANDGTVPFMGGRRIDFNYLFSLKYTGDNVLVKVLRNSEIHELKIKLATHKQFEPAEVKGSSNYYYIIGGLVFITLTIPHLQQLYYKEYFGSRSLPEKQLSRALHEELVILSKVLQAEVNNGYAEDDIINNQVISLNGRPVEGLRGLVSMVESCDEEYLKFIFENQQIVVLRTSEAKKATPDILNTYHIPSDVSEDLKKSRKK